MAKKGKQSICRLCKEQPVWQGNKESHRVCKRCYHKHVWEDRPSARRERKQTQELLEAESEELIFDGYTGEYYRASQYYWWL